MFSGGNRSRALGLVATAAGCHVSGTGPDIIDYSLAAADDQGYVRVTSIDEAGTTSLSYHSYADPTNPRPLATAGRNLYPHGFHLAGAEVSWASHDYSEPQVSATYVVRSSTSGGPARATRIERIVSRTALTPTATGWSGCDTSHGEVCAAGSISRSGVVTEVEGTRTAASDGRRFLIDTYGRSPGVDATAVVGGQRPPTRIATVGLLPPESFGLSLGGGVIGYVDNQGQEQDQNKKILHHRSVTSTSTGLKLGPQQTVGEIGSDRIAQDGASTAYFDAQFGTVGDLWLWNTSGTRTKVFDAQPGASRVGVGPFQLSGQRLLWTKSLHTGQECYPWGCEDLYNDRRLMIYDLRTGVSTEAGPLNSNQTAAIDGDHLVYTQPDQRILHRNLATGAVVEVKGAGPRVAGLDVDGSVVGWSTCVSSDTDSCETGSLGYRDLSSSGGVVERESDQVGSVSLTGRKLAFSTAATMDDPRQLKIWHLDRDTVTSVGQLAPRYHFSADDGMVAWLGQDYLVHLTPLT